MNTYGINEFASPLTADVAMKRSERERLATQLDTFLREGGVIQKIGKSPNMDKLCRKTRRAIDQSMLQHRRDGVFDTTTKGTKQ